MADDSHPAPREPRAHRPGPDVDPAGIESRVDDDADTVTFVTVREAGDETTAWLTVDATHVVDVADHR
jgi:hypothetical protein